VSHVHEQRVPLAALLGAAGLIVTTIALAATSHHDRTTQAPAVVAPARMSAMLRFEDGRDGSVIAKDAATGRTVHEFPPQSNGFVRGVLRGMFRERKLEAIDPHAEFRLAREADGRLTLTDPTSHRVIDLEAFGPTNSGVFAGLLDEAQVAK
jgi:putative photosynthetic complex assembly protein